MEEQKKETLRKAAIKIVDAMHDFEPHVILLCGTSSQPLFSLVAEAWRRRYPKKQLPQPIPVKTAKKADIDARRVALFDEAFITGRSLKIHEQQTKQKGKPTRIKRFALLRAPFKPNYLINGYFWKTKVGAAIGKEFSSEELGRRLRERIFVYSKINRRDARLLAKQERELRRQFREIASSIKPRQTT